MSSDRKKKSHKHKKHHKKHKHKRKHSHKSSGNKHTHTNERHSNNRSHKRDRTDKSNQKNKEKEIIEQKKRPTLPAKDTQCSPPNPKVNRANTTHQSTQRSATINPEKQQQRVPQPKPVPKAKPVLIGDIAPQQATNLQTTPEYKQKAHNKAFKTSFAGGVYKTLKKSKIKHHKLARYTGLFTLFKGRKYKEHLLKEVEAKNLIEQFDNVFKPGENENHNIINDITNNAFRSAASRTQSTKQHCIQNVLTPQEIISIFEALSSTAAKYSAIKLSNHDDPRTLGRRSKRTAREDFVNIASKSLERQLIKKIDNYKLERTTRALNATSIQAEIEKLLSEQNFYPLATPAVPVQLPAAKQSKDVPIDKPIKQQFDDTDLVSRRVTNPNSTYNLQEISPNFAPGPKNPESVQRWWAQQIESTRPKKEVIELFAF